MPSTNPEANATAKRFEAAAKKHLPPELEARTDPRPWGEKVGAAVVDTTLTKDRILVEREYPVDALSRDDDLLALRAQQLAEEALEERARRFG